MNNICPRCGTQALVSCCGGGVECLTCGYGEEDNLSLYAEVMASVPGAPMGAGWAPPRTRVDRYEDAIYRRDVRERQAHDLQLAEGAAARHGVSLEDMWGNMRWKAPSARWAFQSMIADLTICGLEIQRIANVLHKSNRTILKSSGLARGRARRNHG